MYDSLKGKNVVVTGAAGGIGAHIFTRLLEEGAYPIGIDRLSLKCSELEEMLYDRDVPGCDYCFAVGDASDREDMKTVIGEFGVLYGLVNNAGLLGNDASHGGRTDEAWDKIIGNNAKSVYTMTEVCYPLMERGGSIVNIGSIETKMAVPDVVLYTMAKGAVHGATVAYANELGFKNGIRVNTLSPGGVNTRKNIAQFDDPAGKAFVDATESVTPLKRSVEPEEVASLAMFLLSDQSAAVTGEEYIMDCGRTKCYLPYI